MYPHERSLVQRLQGRPFALLGVNSDRSPEALRRAIEKEKLTWRSFWDGSRPGPIATRFNIHGWPTLYLLDGKGIIRRKWVDNPGDKVLDEAIDKLLAEAEGGEKEP
jgi:hypothetical protein